MCPFCKTKAPKGKSPWNCYNPKCPQSADYINPFGKGITRVV